MPLSREVQLERENERLKVQVERLSIENLRLIARLKLMREELQARDDRIAGYHRAWHRIRTRIQHLL